MLRRQTTRRAGRAVLAGVLLVALGATRAAAGADDAGPDALRRGAKECWIPGTYLSIQVRSVSAVLSAVADLADAVRPGAGEQFRTGLGGRLGFPDAGAMQTVGGESPGAVLLLNPNKYDGHFAFAVGDGGVGAFVGAIAQAVNEEVGGNELIELGELMLGADKNMIYMKHVAPWIVGAADPDAMDALAKAVNRGKVPRAPKGRDQIAASVDMREIRAAFGGVVAGYLQMGRAGTTMLQMRQRRGGPDPKLVSRMLQEYITAFEAMFEGFDRFDVSARLGRESVELSARALPGSESAFAPLAKSQRAAEFSPALVLPEDGMITVALRLEEAATKGIADALAEALLRVASDPAMPGQAEAGQAEPGAPGGALDAAAEEELEEFREIAREWLKGESATAVSHRDGRMESVWVVDKDRAAFRKMYDRAMGLMTGELGALMKGLGLGMSYQYQEDVRRARGRPVDRITLTYALEGEAGEEMGVVLQAVMGGLTQVTELASLGSGGTVVAWSEDAAKTLDEALEREAAAAEFEGKGWPGASKELKAVLERAPEKTWLAFEFRLCSYLEFAMSMMRNAQPAAAAVMPNPDGLGKDDVPIVGWCASEKDEIVFHERVPVAPIRKLVKFFEDAQAGGRRGPLPPLPGDETDVF